MESKSVRVKGRDLDTEKGNPYSGFGGLKIIDERPHGRSLWVLSNNLNKSRWTGGLNLRVKDVKILSSN